MKSEESLDAFRSLENVLMKSKCFTLFFILLSSFFTLSANAADINVTVSDAQTKESIIMGSVSLSPLGQYAVTDYNGKAHIRNIPQGTYTLTVSYVGYETYTTQVIVKDKNLDMLVKMNEASLMLKEVSVTAKQSAAGTSTASIIGRQAIDHLQASSLADVMQLVPGQLMSDNNLTSTANSRPQLRVASDDAYDNTAAFGTTVIIDGVPVSNNGNISTSTTVGSDPNVGTDLRNISADDINEVEVVRGIPSAEYGDLTSGMVIVHSKVGVTPVQIKAKINPAQMNYSVGKGENFGKAGIFNASFDYAQAWGDPRYKTNSFHRYTGTLGWSYDINPRWNINTKFRYVMAREWTGDDPDATVEGTDKNSKNQTISLTHNGRVQVEKFFARTINYTVGVTFNSIDYTESGFAHLPSGINPIITARETGYYEVPYIRQADNYRTKYYRESRPDNIYAKVNDRFYVEAGKTRQTFKVGVEYHYDWNKGAGSYNEDETHPMYPNADGQRPRAYSDIPGLHQISAYAEDQLVWTINKVNRLRATFGLRFTAMQPFSDVATTALSPRLNLSFSLTKWLDIRAGIGLNSKTPGINYLYPDKKYSDTPASPADTETRTQAWHTQVYEVKFSKNLKNATTTKAELGFDVRLKNGKKLSILGYIDSTPNGFGNLTEYFTYPVNYYSSPAMQGNPERTDVIFITTGAVGNTSHSLNRGIELDMDFGTWKAIRTSFYLSGAYQESKTWSTNMNSASLDTRYLPQSYKDAGTTPFKVVYPNGLDNSYSRYRRLVTTLRTVTHIPELAMVASLTTQFVWHNWQHTYIFDKDPIGWIDTDCQYHNITPDMLAGYLGMDAKYYEIPPLDQEYVGMYQLLSRSIDTETESSPIEWNIQARLTKEFGKVGGFSFYVNNALYYEPFLRGNSHSKTRTQYNNGFSFGAELYFNL